MRKIGVHISVLFLSGLLASCGTSRKSVGEVRRDSIRVETVVRTEYVRDTVQIEIPVERVMQIAADSSHLETQYAVSDALLRADGKLYHTLVNKAGKRIVEADKRIEYRDSIVYRDRNVERTVEVERKLTWWQKFRLKGFWVLGAAVICCIVLKLRKII